VGDSKGREVNLEKDGIGGGGKGTRRIRGGGER